VNRAALRPIDPKAYEPHALHRVNRAWVESNCYVDLWIEILHALGCEPVASLPYVLTIDWEGDQFTFFKPPHRDLDSLYGLDVQELNVYRPLVETAAAQLEGGKLVLAEADSFFLPDTAGTDYRRNHVKTTIGIQELDIEARRLGYFHNAGYHALEGDDFAQLFRLGAPDDPTFMPFFAEFVRTGRAVRLEDSSLVARSKKLLGHHLARLPSRNPIEAFAARLEADVEGLVRAGLPTYHLYAFATVRQLGAACELATTYLAWLDEHGEPGLERSAAAFAAISELSKAVILKLGRTVGNRKPADVSSLLSEAARRWREGTECLASRYGAGR